MKPSEFLKLNATPNENGRTIGRIAGAAFRHRVQVVRKIQKVRSIPDRLLNARIKDFTRNVRKVAPHWLDEVEGLAQGAGVGAQDILLLNCLPPGFPPTAGNNCTSFLSIGARENRLFKIRDERNHVQALYISDARRRRRFQAANDIGNIGVAHFFNENALAGANDTGSPTDLVPDDPRFNDCHLLRYVAERAGCVGEIPALFERLLKAGVVGGAGPGRGAIFLFVDPNRGLILECQSQDYSAQFVDSGMHVLSNHFVTEKAKAWESRPPDKNTLLRAKRMEVLLARHGDNPSLCDVFALSRDRKSLPHALCNDSGKHPWMTVSAQLQVIDRNRPEESVNYACCGNTRNSVYIPVPITAGESFAPLLDGRFFRYTDRLYRQCGCGAHLRKQQNDFEKRMIDQGDYHRACMEAFSLVRGVCKGELS